MLIKSFLHIKSDLGLEVVVFLACRRDLLLGVVVFFERIKQMT